MNKPVNFELAKLLKEKGFDLKPNRHLVKKTSKIGFGKEFIIDRSLDYDDLYLEYVEKHIPTIAEVVMWLYEKHGIWIVAFPELFNGEIVKFYPSIFEQGVGEDIEQYYNSPTEALEAALVHKLTLI